MHGGIVCEGKQQHYLVLSAPNSVIFVAHLSSWDFKTQHMKGGMMLKRLRCRPIKVTPLLCSDSGVGKLGGGKKG